MTEAFLHYVWLHRMLNEGLATTDGQPLEVLRPGTPNPNAGPDFFGAHLRVNGVEWVGNVELHVRTSDWKAHGHSADPAYNNIVLHVVYEHDCDIRLQNGLAPLTLELRSHLSSATLERYQALLNPTAPTAIACADAVGQLPDFLVGSHLDRLLVERIEAKTAVVRRFLDESHGGWEQTCYWLMAHYFGGKVNALPFELLAKATDQRLLARWKDNPERLEALLMGQAGLLQPYFDDEYPRRLQADYEALREAAHLAPISPELWKFFCLRPSSFPTIRISQFAQLVHRSTNLFATLLGCTSASDIRALLDQPAAPYWITHYHFDQPAATSAPKRVGRTQADLLIINAWVPLLFVYGTEHRQPQYREQALDLLRQLPPERNHIITQWTTAGIRPANAAQSQALLQLFNLYCTNRRCLDCSFGYHILKQR